MFLQKKEKKKRKKSEAFIYLFWNHNNVFVNNKAKTMSILNKEKVNS